MTADARILPFRRPDLDGPPDHLMRLLEACEGVPDATVARLIARYFPEVTEPLIERAVRIPSERPRLEVVRDA